MWELHYEPASGSQKLQAAIRGGEQGCRLGLVYATGGNRRDESHLDPTDPGRNYISQEAPQEEGHFFTLLWNPGPYGKVACKVNGLCLGGSTGLLRCVPGGLKGRAGRVWRLRPV